MSDDEKIRQARARLDRVADNLDSLTVARLRAARLRAVAAAGEAGKSRMHLWWLPLSTAVAATLVAVTVALLWWRAPEPEMMATATDDIELLTARETPDFFNEQLEFYHWLGDDQDAS
jgi:hypothetical protein